MSNKRNARQISVDVDENLVKKVKVKDVIASEDDKSSRKKLILNKNEKSTKKPTVPTVSLPAAVDTGQGSKSGALWSFKIPRNKSRVPKSVEHGLTSEDSKPGPSTSNSSPNKKKRGIPAAYNEDLAPQRELEKLKKAKVGRVSKEKIIRPPVVSAKLSRPKQQTVDHTSHNTAVVCSTPVHRDETHVDFCDFFPQSANFEDDSATIESPQLFECESGAKSLASDAEDLISSPINDVPSPDIPYPDPSDEPMDWEKVEPDETQNTNFTLSEVNLTSINQQIERGNARLHIVIDTNILIHHLNKINALLNDATSEDLVITIPWVVLLELDTLSKGEKDIRVEAKKAHRLLLQHLTKKNPKINGQSGTEEREADVFFKATNNDDKILQACLQLRAQGHRVLLNTDDQNLALKAAVSEVETLNSGGLIKMFPSLKADERANYLNETRTSEQLRASSISPTSSSLAAQTSMQVVTSRSNVSSSQVSQVVVSQSKDVDKVASNPADTDFEELLRQGLEIVLEKEFENVYSFPEEWETKVSIPPKPSRPFWTLKETFRCINKHWNELFTTIDGLNFSSRKSIEELSSIVTRISAKDRRLSFWQRSSPEEKLSSVEKSIHVLSMFYQRPYYNNIEPIVRKLQNLQHSTSAMMAFNIIWQQIFCYVANYCQYLEVPYEHLPHMTLLPEAHKLPKPPSELFADHLEMVAHTVNQLSNSFSQLLCLDPTTLPDYCPELKAFHADLSTVFTKFNQKRPNTFPALPQLPANSLTLESIRSFVTSPMNFPALHVGNEQLQTLRYLAFHCFATFQNVMADCDKLKSFLCQS